MPLFEFVCGNGHRTERLAARDTEMIWCSCGQPSARASVYRVNVTGFTPTPIDQREVRLGEFQEATAEIAYKHERAENAAGQRLPPPPLWRRAKQEARRLRRLGIKDSADYEAAKRR
mgnify:FL=1